jgi:predicted DNA-binding transcriptional regulator AlpA
MNEPAKNPFDLLVDQIRVVVREEIAAALSNGAEHPAEKDKLLTPEEAAEIIGVDKKWLYRHAKQLPFTRKLSRKAMRFNEVGLRRWMATRK